MVNFINIRRLSVHAEKFFVTTPIYYVNAQPHIGHLYSSVIADAVSRWHQIKNKGILSKFSTGTDEHGTKIQEAALRNKSSPIEYCNKISNTYRKLADNFNVNYTDFIRTTDSAHKEVVHKFWNVLEKNGYIYSANYSGWYCVADETFLTESQLKETDSVDGKKILVSAESGHPVEWTEEQNYMFPLEKLQDNLIYWVKKDRSIYPAKFQKIVLDTITGQTLPAISISRPSSRVHWGIPVPNDPQQTVYVWLDALVNYLTVAGYGDNDNQSKFQRFWPPNLHVIGKDILKFHAIYWPGFLIAANLEPPNTILCHSHWTVDGEKMSKSKNNVVCPFESSSLFGTDGLRYFLLREGVAHSDGNFSNTKTMRILNSELADTLGNLLSRCCGNALNPHKIFPKIESEQVFDHIATDDVAKKLIDLLSRLPEKCSKHYEDYNFYKAIDEIIATLHQANLFFETFKPWELKKKKDFNELNAVIHLTMEALRIAGILLQPIIPNISKNLLDILNISPENRYYNDTCKFTWEKSNFESRQILWDKSVLYKRII